MQIRSTRFGLVSIDRDDVFSFPNGLIGFKQCQQWVLLADAQTPLLGWLQCVTHADVAVAVASPRRFAPEYHVRIPSAQLAALELDAVDRAYVLCVVANNDGRLTMNLRAPLIINLDRRLGRQVVTSDDQPLQYALSFSSSELRKAA